jgi:hypothetical protein
MRGFRLNGWQRIGIVLSVVWAVVGPIYIEQEHEAYARDEARFSYRLCRDAQSSSADPSECSKDYDRTYEAFLGWKPSWGNWALLAFVPIVGGWLLMWGIVALVRWIRRGFRLST